MTSSAARRLPRKDGTAGRILNLFGTFAVLDADLLARALDIRPATAQQSLCHLARTGRVLGRVGQPVRRPYVRVEYQRVDLPGAQGDLEQPPTVSGTLCSCTDGARNAPLPWCECRGTGVRR